MNQRNVDVLYELIQEALVDIQYRSALAGDAAVRRGLAERLASRGVLVPSALTDEECDTVWSEMLPAFRILLERIAKGEPV